MLDLERFEKKKTSVSTYPDKYKAPFSLICVQTSDGWKDANVASFDDRVQVMINNCIHVCVSLENLKKTENL